MYKAVLGKYDPKEDVIYEVDIELEDTDFPKLLEKTKEYPTPSQDFQRWEITQTRIDTFQRVTEQ